jgi:hypothetical protein
VFSILPNVSNSAAGQSRDRKHAPGIEISASAHSKTTLEKVMRYLKRLPAQRAVSASSRARPVALSFLLVGSALLGAVSPAFATFSDVDVITGVESLPASQSLSTATQARSTRTSVHTLGLGGTEKRLGLFLRQALA